MKDAELELGSHAQGKHNEHLQRLALASAGDAGRDGWVCGPGSYAKAADTVKDDDAGCGRCG
jgi:hypothetical protein